MVTGDKRTGPKKYSLAVAGIMDELRTNMMNEKNYICQGSDPNVMGTIETSLLRRF